MDLAVDHSSHGVRLDELIDTEAIARELERLATDRPGGEHELRTAVAQRLKSALAKGRAEAERRLLEDKHGRRCAERLCRMEDEIIRLLFDFARKHLYPSTNPSEAERMAVVATGGYGRGLQAPGSDIDLLFVLPYKQTAWGESIAEAILYCLWDLGLKVGHATRSVDECIRQSKSDITIRTAILEARFLLGDRALFDELIKRFDEEVVRGTATEFVTAKLAEREERHRRSGQSRYLVEPNVKDGKGGLRDLHTLFWIAKYVYRVRTPEELIARGVFESEEYELFRRCEDFLWSVRCNMHFLAGRAEERLSFDIQREIAVRLGYTEHPGLQDVERFMKHYFLVAKDVGDLTAILCAELEDSHAKSVPVLSRVMAKLRPVKRRTLDDNDDFIVEHNRIRCAKPNVFERDPVNLIRVFELAQKHNLVQLSIAELIAYRQIRDKLVERVGEFELVSEIGPLKGYAYITPFDRVHHMAFVYGDLARGREVPARLHRADVIGDVFGGAKTIHAALQRFQAAGRGVIVYLRDGTAGVPVAEIPHGDTGTEAARSRQWREVGLGAQILKDLGISSIRLLSSSQRTYVGLGGFGIEIAGTEKLEG